MDWHLDSDLILAELVVQLCFLHVTLKLCPVHPVSFKHRTSPIFFLAVHTILQYQRRKDTPTLHCSFAPACSDYYGRGEGVLRTLRG